MNNSPDSRPQDIPEPDWAVIVRASADDDGKIDADLLTRNVTVYRAMRNAPIPPGVPPAVFRKMFRDSADEFGDVDPYFLGQNVAVYKAIQRFPAPDDIPGVDWEIIISDSLDEHHELHKDALEKNLEVYRIQRKKEAEREKERIQKGSKGGATTQNPVPIRDPTDDGSVRKKGLTQPKRRELIKLLQGLNAQAFDNASFEANGSNDKAHGIGNSGLGGMGIGLMRTSDYKYRIVLSILKNMRLHTTLTEARFINAKPTGKQLLEALQQNIEKDGKEDEDKGKGKDKGAKGN